MNTNTFYKTFSGIDAIGFLIFPEAKPILLGSLSTISYSVYREKKPVPLLGKINTGGYTRGMRSIAGTMVFTLINQHLVEDIAEQVPYIGEHGKMLADELPFFDIMIICANEYGAASQMYIYGAEFFEDGEVVSVQDLYIENTFSFVARDIDPFTRINPIVNSGNINAAYRTETLVGYAFSKPTYDNLYESVTNGEYTKNNAKIINAQTALKDKGYDIKITGVENQETVDAIKKYQSENNLTVTGELNDATYGSITAGNDEKKVAYKISNKNGAYVYKEADGQEPIGVASYQSDYLGDMTQNGYVKIDFAGNQGYIKLDDTDKKVSSRKEAKCEDKMTSGRVYNTTLKDFKPEQVGSVITPYDKSQYKISAISYYNNGETTSNQRYFTIDKNTSKDLNLSYLSSAFTYNNNNGLPYMIDYMITEVGTNKFKKWTVMIK